MYYIGESKHTLISSTKNHHFLWVHQTINGPFSIALSNYQRVRRMFVWNKYPTAENLHQVVQALAETNSAERLRETHTQPVACWNVLGAWIFTWIEFIHTLTIGIQIVTALTNDENEQLLEQQWTIPLVRNSQINKFFLHLTWVTAPVVSDKYSWLPVIQTRNHSGATLVMCVALYSLIFTIIYTDPTADKSRIHIHKYCDMKNAYNI